MPHPGDLNFQVFISLKFIIFFSRNVAITGNYHVNNLTCPCFEVFDNNVWFIGRGGTVCVNCEVPKNCHIFSIGDLYRMMFVPFLRDFDVVMLAHILEVLDLLHE